MFPLRVSVTAVCFSSGHCDLWPPGGQLQVQRDHLEAPGTVCHWGWVDECRPLSAKSGTYYTSIFVYGHNQEFWRSWRDVFLYIYTHIGYSVERLILICEWETSSPEATELIKLKALLAVCSYRPLVRHKIHDVIGNIWCELNIAFRTDWIDLQSQRFGTACMWLSYK